MNSAWNDCVGIGVDVHVDRISRRLGWVKPTFIERDKATIPVKKMARLDAPEETRRALEAWLPFEYWPRINKMLVGFGQLVCIAGTPKCAQCPVAHLCPSSKCKNINI